MKKLAVVALGGNALLRDNEKGTIQCTFLKIRGEKWEREKNQIH